MITKPNSKVGSGRSHVLPATFLVRNQINHIFRITRKSGMNGVFFARLKAKK